MLWLRWVNISSRTQRLANSFLPFFFFLKEHRNKSITITLCYFYLNELLSTYLRSPQNSCSILVQKSQAGEEQNIEKLLQWRRAFTTLLDNKYLNLRKMKHFIGGTIRIIQRDQLSAWLLTQTDHSAWLHSAAMPMRITSSDWCLRSEAVAVCSGLSSYFSLMWSISSQLYLL